MKSQVREVRLREQLLEKFSYHREGDSLALNSCRPRTVLHQLLREHAWLRGTTDGELAKLVASSHQRRFHSKEFLLRIGSTTDSLIMVASGFVASTAVDAEGRGYISNWMGRGELLNVIPVLDRGATFHDYVAKTDVVAYTMSGETFRWLVQNNPNLSHQLLQYLCRRARKFQGDIHESTFSSLFSRCARVLLSLAESHGTLTTEGTLLNLAISQEELGEMLGCARQSVNKELGRLEEMGAISLHSRARYLIRDMELLRRIALLDLRAGASA